MPKSETILKNIHSLVFVIQYAAHHLNLKISNNTIKDLLLKHPDYPNISSVVEVLSKLKIDCKAVRINSTQLLDLKPTFFTNLIGEGLVFVTKISATHITYYSHNSGVVNENITLFNTKWNGITILFDHRSALKETNFKSQKYTEIFKKRRALLAALTPLLLLPLLLDNSFSILSLLFIAKCLGLSVCVYQSLIIINKESNLTKYCEIGNKFSCTDVLNSSASKLFGWISFSDIGFVYFITGIFILLFHMLNNQLNSLVSILTIASFLTLPYTLFSVFHQAFVLKKWCISCLMILGILWLEAILLGIHLNYHHLIVPNISEVSTSIFTLAITILAWSYSKEALINSNSLHHIKYPFYRMSNHKSVFNILHQNTLELTQFPKSEPIILGDPNAEHSILLILNPFCPSCATEYINIQNIYTNNPSKVSISLVFTGEMFNPYNLSNKVSLSLIELHKQLDSFTFNNIIMEWFKEKNYDAFKKKHPNIPSEQTLKILDEHMLWLQKVNIIQTPSLFFNNKKISNQYTAEQLAYFI